MSRKPGAIQATGLMDPLTSDPKVLDRLLERLALDPLSQGSSAERSAVGVRPATYADLQAMLGLDHERFACAYTHTLRFTRAVQSRTSDMRRAILPT